MQGSDALSRNQHKDRTRERYGAPLVFLRRELWGGRIAGRFGGADEVEGFLEGVDAAFELCVFGEGEELFEARAGLVAGVDEVAAGEQEFGPDGVGRELGEALAGEVVEAEVAVAGEAVDAVQGEVLVELGQAEEALEGGFAHIFYGGEAHVVVDEGEDLIGFVIGEAEAAADFGGDFDADFDVAVEADAVGGALEGGGLADVVEERSPGERGGAVGGKFLEEQEGVDPDITLGVVLRGLLDAVEAVNFGEDFRQQAGFVEELEGAAGVALGEHAGEFVADALAADLGDLGREVAKGGGGFWSWLRGRLARK